MVLVDKAYAPEVEMLPLTTKPEDESSTLQETTEIPFDCHLTEDIENAIKEHEEGKGLDFEEFWRTEMDDKQLGEETRT